MNDSVGSDVTITADSLTIASTANIQGDLIYTSKDEATIESGATIAGTITHKLAEARKAISWPQVGIWARVIFFLMTLLTGIIIILISPKRAKSTVNAIKGKPWQSLGWGALILFATPIAAIIAFIIIIGIPVGLIGLALYGIALFISQIVVGLFIGSWIIANPDSTLRKGMRFTKVRRNNPRAKAPIMIPRVSTLPR